MADTAALVVALSAQVSKFEKDMKDAVGIADRQTKAIEQKFSAMQQSISNELGSFARNFAAQAGSIGSVLQSIGPVGLTIAAGLGAAAVAMNFLTEKTDKFVAKQKEMAEAAEVTGLSLNQIKAIGIVATKVGVDFEKAERGIIRMSIAIEELRTKGSGPLLDTLNRINPALARQVITAESSAEAIDLIAAAMANMSKEQQQLAFGAELFGKRQVDNVRILKELAAQGGLQNIAKGLEESGKGIDKELNARLRAMRIEIDAIQKRTDNLFGRAFAPEILAAEKASAEFWERIASAVAKVADRARDAKPVVNQAINQQFLEGGVPLGDLAAPAKPIARPTPVQIVDTVLPQARPTEAIDNMLKQNKALEDQQKLLASQLTFQERWVALLGDAATEQEKLTLKQLQNNKAVQDNVELAPAAARGLSAFKLAQQEANVALKERLGVATEAEIVTVKLARAEEQIARLALSGADAERVRAKAVQDSKTAYENMIIAASRLPELTRFAIEGQDQLKQFSQLAINSFGAFENAIADVATGTSSLQDAFKKMADSIIRDLIRITIRMAITAPLANALGGLFGGGTSSNLFAGFGRAAGGPVQPGQPYVVGEKGPELFVPKSAGTIVPSALTPGKSATGSTVEINNYVAADTETKQSKMQEGPGSEKIVIDIVRRAQARGEFDPVQRARFGLRPNKVR